MKSIIEVGSVEKAFEAVRFLLHLEDPADSLTCVRVYDATEGLLAITPTNRTTDKSDIKFLIVGCPEFVGPFDYDEYGAVKQIANCLPDVDSPALDTALTLLDAEIKKQSQEKPVPRRGWSGWRIETTNFFGRARKSPLSSVLLSRY